MHETRTPYRHVLIIDLSITPASAAAIKRHLYGDAPRPGLEFMVAIGCLIDLETKPLETIMTEVTWRLEQHPGVDGIYLVGDSDQYELEALCQEIARRTRRETSAINIDELIADE